jgi:hypothetical protein
VFSIKKKKKKKEEKLRSFHKIAFDIMKQASLCPSQSFITEVIANYLKRSSEQTKAPRLREKGKKKCSCSPISFSNQALFLPHVRHRDQKPSLVFSTNTNVCHTASTAATIGSQKL